MDNKDFAHLHNHDEYSLLDGMGKAEDWASRAKEMGFTSLASTNHGNCDGVIKFQSACDDAGMKSIIGCEAYIVPNMVVKEAGEKRNHITLLVKNQTGWRNLLQMLTYANLQGFYYKPRIDPDLLLQYAEGLVIMTACTSGVLNMEESVELLEKLRDNGSDVYLEVMPLDMADQVTMNQACVDIQESTGLKLVASNDCHYPLSEHSKYQEVLLAMQSKTVLSNPDRWKFSVDDLYLKSADEMIESFMNQDCLTEDTIAHAMLNAVEIADLCNFHLEPQEPKLPLVSVPKYPDLDEADQIISLAFDGLEKRAEDHKWIRASISEYEERIEEEFGHIIPQFTRYFLIVWELINWCEENDIMVGPGRGSAAGSLVSYCLGITDIDPIKYKLIFSRFISPGRIDLPDIDMDFEDIKRPLILGHLEDVYGKWNVLEVSNFLKMKGRGAITDVGRVFEVPTIDIRKAADVIVTRSSGDFRSDFTIEDAFETFEDGKAFKAKYPEVVKMAIAFEGQVKTTGRHAAAICVSSEDLRSGNNSVIVMRKGHKVCNWNKDDAETTGLMKLDILGLNGLTILNQSRKMIKYRHKVDINYNLIDLEDKKLLNQFTQGNTIGIFQFNSPGMIKLCRDIHADKFDDVIALNALHRPGALRSGMTQVFKNRKFGIEETTYVHPWIEGITKDTHGLIIYQEQVMRLMYELGGLPWKTADTIRKVISKSKGVEEFMKFEQEFMDGCERLGTLTAEEAGAVFGELKNMGSYSFNLCLSGDTNVLRSSAGKSSKAEVTIKELYDVWGSKTATGQKYRDPNRGLEIQQVDPDGRIRPGKIKKIRYSGSQRLFELKTESGKTIRATANHRFLTDRGYLTVSYIDNIQSKIAVMGKKEPKSPHKYRETVRARGKTYDGSGFKKSEGNPSYIDGRTDLLRTAKKVVYERAQRRCEECGRTISRKCTDCGEEVKLNRYEFAHVNNIQECNYDYETYHSTDNITCLCNSCHKKLDYKKGERKVRNSIGYPVTLEAVVSITDVGIADTYDVEMDTEGHNFIANGIVSHNSHANAYATIAMWMMYLKVYYPTEFMCTTLSYGPDKKKHEQISEAKRLGLKILLPDINISDASVWSINAEDNLIAPFTEVKGIGDKAAKVIVDERDNNGPYQDTEDLDKRTPSRPVTSKVRGLLERAMAYSDSEEKLNMSNEELDILSEIFDFELSNDPLYKYRGVMNKFEGLIDISPISECDDLAGNQYYFGKMERLTVGYKDAIGKGSKGTDGFGSLGSIYGSLRDDSDFKMIVFGAKIYEDKKYDIEHCEGEAMLTNAGITRSKSALVTQSVWFGNELLSGDIDGFGLGFANESGLGGEVFHYPLLSAEDIEWLSECDMCDLRAECKKPVYPTQGSINAMILGEAPGRDEDRLGEGFRGRAGELLDETLEERGLDRTWFHIGNIVKCWPSVTKTPKKAHIATCSKWIKEEIKTIKPFIILSFGNTGNLFFRGESTGIMNLSGKTIWNDEYNCWVSYCIHPSAVLRTPENRAMFDEGMDEFGSKFVTLGYG